MTILPLGARSYCRDAVTISGAGDFSLFNHFRESGLHESIPDEIVENDLGVFFRRLVNGVYNSASRRLVHSQLL